MWENNFKHDGKPSIQEGPNLTAFYTFLCDWFVGYLHKGHAVIIQINVLLNVLAIFGHALGSMLFVVIIIK